MECPRCGAENLPKHTDECPICFADLNAPMPTQGAVMHDTAGLAAPAGMSNVHQLNVADAEEALDAGIPGLNLPAAPSPYGTGQPVASGGMGSGQVRVSLTGEVIEVAAPTPRGMPTPGAPTGPARAGGPIPPRGAPPRAAAPSVRGRPAADEGVQKSGAGPVAFVMLLVLVLGGGGFGGWYWYNNRTNPKDQAMKVLTAMKGQDWKGMYELTAMSDADKSKFPTAQAYADEVEKQMNSNPIAKAFVSQLFAGMGDLSVGEATVTGDKADVPTSMKMTVGGQSATFHGTAHMIRQAGLWKLDATGGQAADLKVGQDLIGQPENAGGAGGFGMPRR